ncbi:MAG TPA: glycosyltransferase [Thermoplasmata archaeon]|nr:glycosyltransferase [Thermoplasmata archaeon]
MTKKYSICVTNFNSIRTVESWASSLLRNVGEEDEVVVVDAGSADGSGDWLRSWCLAHGYVFLTRKSNRGQARDVASRGAHGDYLIHHVDTDDVVVALPEAKRLYHEVLETDAVTGARRAFWCHGFFIVPRAMYAEVGGYAPLQHYEDRLLGYRLAVKGWLTKSERVSAVRKRTDPRRTTVIAQLRRRIEALRDGFRLGFVEIWTRWSYPLIPIAFAMALFMKHYPYRKDWERMDIHRDELIVSWIDRNHLKDKLLPVR